MKKVKQVIPGLKISMGITITFLSLVVLIPMTSLVINASDMGIKEFIITITNPRAISGYKVSFGCAFIATAINSFFGLIISWVLVRYDFYGKRVVDGLIELPFTLPTAVAGIALTTLYSTDGPIGKYFNSIGIKISYTRTGIVLAMIFIGIPFIVRTIQPVLEGIHKEYEEAATMLGASKIRIFFKVIFPEILPALLTGFGLSFARAVGEYGSVVFIASNMPYKTEIAPLLIMSKLEQFDYNGANAIALVMLIISFGSLFIINTIQIHSNKFIKE